MFETLSSILAVILGLTTLIVGARLILKRKLPKILLVPFFALVLLLQYMAGFLIFVTLLEIFPYSKHTPCFSLNVRQCEKRQGCAVGVADTGLGQDSSYCYKK